MNGTIPIHPKRGLDPHLTFCPRCGGETNELAIGHLKVATLRDGRKMFFNRGELKRALNGAGLSQSDVTDTRDAKEHERVPASQICEACQKEVASFDEEVKKGGVHFRCKQCQQTGVIKAESDFAKHVREFSKIEAPNPVGVEFTSCTEHGVEEHEKD